MEASRVGNAEMAQFLIENGADPNVVNGVSYNMYTLLVLLSGRLCCFLSLIHRLSPPCVCDGVYGL